MKKKNRMNDGPWMAYLWMDEVHSPSLVQAGERKYFKKSQNVFIWNGY